jgi:hypothetical protein
MSDRELTKARMEIARLVTALEFYAEPDNYFATTFLFDPPCGEFRDDFSRDRWTKLRQFDRAMPGKRARRAIAKYVSFEKMS